MWWSIHIGKPWLLSQALREGPSSSWSSSPPWTGILQSRGWPLDARRGMRRCPSTDWRWIVQQWLPLGLKLECALVRECVRFRQCILNLHPLDYKIGTLLCEGQLFAIIVVIDPLFGGLPRHLLKHLRGHLLTSWIYDYNTSDLPYFTNL